MGGTATGIAEVDVNVDTVSIIDVDSHVAELPDLWTSRASKKWKDLVPHLEWDGAGGEHRRRVDGVLLSGVGEFCTAGWREHFPSHPPTLEEADPACYERHARPERLDEYRVFGQVLYPNLFCSPSGAALSELRRPVPRGCCA